jgi:hypothetical protein
MHLSAAADCGPPTAAPAGWRCLECLSVSRGKNADPLGQRHKFHQGLDLHFLHHTVAMCLDGTLGAA